MIKILFFIETLSGGGAEKVLCNLVNNMDRQKFDITVQTLWPAEAEKYLAPDVRYKSVYKKRSRLNNLLYRLDAALGLTYKKHIRDGYDIECAYLETGATKIMAASTDRRAKKLAWVHCDLSKKVGDVRAFVKKTAGLYKAFDKVVCVSGAVRDSFANMFGNEPPAVVIHNTIDDGEIRRKAVTYERLENTRPIVVSVGRLSVQKRFDRLLKAHKMLIDRGIEHELWILGEGPERPSLEAYIKENAIEGSAKLLGFTDNPYPVIAAADMTVCSSDYEGMSTAAIESLILGVPMVTTDCTGMRELFGDNECGIITDMSAEALAEGLLGLLTDKNLLKAYAEKAAERGKCFSARASAQLTEGFFEELLNDNSVTAEKDGR